MLRLVGVRLLAGIATLFAASVLIFGTMEFLPGDIATAVLQREASDEETLAALRKEYGLDRPAVVRYAEWLAGAVTLDFGRSVANDVAVNDLIGTRLKNSLILLFLALVLMFPLALFIGTYSALKQGSAIDGGFQIFTLILASLPSFVVGIGFILVFAFFWELLPAVSLEPTPRNLVLPVATLVLGWMPLTARMVRTGVLQALDSEYVQMARLKGTPEAAVVRRHVLPNALVPAIQAFALTAASIPAGIVIIEYLFAYPGIGEFLVQSVQTRDTITVEAITLILVAIYVIANLLSDIATTMLTPRLRTST